MINKAAALNRFRDLFCLVYLKTFFTFKKPKGQKKPLNIHILIFGSHYSFSSPHEMTKTMMTHGGRIVGIKSKRKEEPEDQTEELQCSICVDLLIQPTNLDACAHVFCNACISIWNMQSKQCPLCRAVFLSLSTVRVHRRLHRMLADEVENLTPAEKEVYDLRVASAPSRLKDATDERELVRGARAAQLYAERTAAAQRQRQVLRQLSELIAGVREASTVSMEAMVALSAATATAAAAAAAVQRQRQVHGQLLVSMEVIVALNAAAATASATAAAAAAARVARVVEMEASEALVALNAASATAAAATVARGARVVEMEAASAALTVATAEVAAASALVGQISI